MLIALCHPGLQLSITLILGSVKHDRLFGESTGTEPPPQSTFKWEYKAWSHSPGCLSDSQAPPSASREVALQVFTTKFGSAVCF